MSGDLTNTDADVDDALVQSQQLLEQYLGRGLYDSTGAWVSRMEYGTFTEKVRIHPDGRAYPLGRPIQSVSSPAGALVVDATWLAQLIADQNPLWDFLVEPYRYGPGGVGGYFDTTMPLATVQYVGGFTLTTLPRKLRQALADLTRVEMTVFDPSVAGVSQAQVGDVTVKYTDAPDRAGVVDAILRTVAGYRFREIGH